MSDYWDTSALVEAAADLSLRWRVHQDRPVTRTHSLAEAFSVLTGGKLGVRVDATDAIAALENLVPDLRFVDLSVPEVVAALKTARRMGVRGGKVHDLLHAAAAELQQSGKVVTLDPDFLKLTKLPVEIL